MKQRKSMSSQDALLVLVVSVSLPIALFTAFVSAAVYLDPFEWSGVIALGFLAGLMLLLWVILIRHLLKRFPAVWEHLAEQIESKGTAEQQRKVESP